MDHNNEKTGTYKRRWYILMVFSLYTMWNCAIWNTWGPVANTAKQLYGWTDGTITLFAFWGCLNFPIWFLPSAWLLGKSLKWSVILGGVLMVFASGLRVIPLFFEDKNDQLFLWLCHIGAILNTIPGPIAMSAPIQISSVWFPPMERSLATSIGQMFNALGIGVSFILGTVIFSNIDDTHNCQQLDNTHIALNSTICRQATSDQENGIKQLLFIHFGVSVAILICMVVYYPNEPPLPPSISASKPRTLFLDGFKLLLKSKDAWLTMLTYGISQGVAQMWLSVLVINLVALQIPGVNEEWASTLGIFVSFVSVFASILVAAFLKFFKKRMKRVIAILLSCSVLVYVFMALIFLKFIKIEESSQFQISTYVLLLIGQALTCASAPLLFEFSVETCYPVAEGCIGTWLTVWFNIFSLLFLAVFQIPGIGTEWTNYVLPVSGAVSIPLLILVNEQYNRLNIDITKHKS